MPAKTTLNGKPAGAPASYDPSANREEPDSDGLLSPNERLIAERTERRRLRAAAHDAPSSVRKPRGSGRARPTSALGRRTGTTLRGSLLVMLIALMAAGAALGAILGSLSVASWVTGLLVAGVTVILSAGFRSVSSSP